MQKEECAPWWADGNYDAGRADRCKFELLHLTAADELDSFLQRASACRNCSFMWAYYLAVPVIWHLFGTGQMKQDYNNVAGGNLVQHLTASLKQSAYILPVLCTTATEHMLL